MCGEIIIAIKVEYTNEYFPSTKLFSGQHLSVILLALALLHSLLCHRLVKVLFSLNTLILHLFHFKWWHNRAQKDIWAFLIVPARNERQRWCCITRVHQTDAVQLCFGHLLRLPALLACESWEI